MCSVRRDTTRRDRGLSGTGIGKHSATLRKLPAFLVTFSRNLGIQSMCRNIAWRLLAVTKCLLFALVVMTSTLAQSLRVPRLEFEVASVRPSPAAPAAPAARGVRIDGA